MVIYIGCKFCVRKFVVWSCLVKNITDFNKYKYSGDGTGFDAPGSWSLSNNADFGKNAIIFGAGMTSSVHIDDRKNNIRMLG